MSSLTLISCCWILYFERFLDLLMFHNQVLVYLDFVLSVSANQNRFYLLNLFLWVSQSVSSEVNELICFCWFVNTLVVLKLFSWNNYNQIFKHEFILHFKYLLPFSDQHWHLASALLNCILEKSSSLWWSHWFSLVWHNQAAIKHNLWSALQCHTWSVCLYTVTYAV